MVGVAALWGGTLRVIGLMAAVYPTSVIQSLQQIIANARNPFGGLAPERARLEKRCRFNTYIAIGASQ